MTEAVGVVEAAETSMASDAPCDGVWSEVPCAPVGDPLQALGKGARLAHSRVRVLAER